MDQKNVFDFDETETHNYHLIRYQPGHSILFVKLHMQMKILTLVFENVRYYQGSVGWGRGVFDTSTLIEYFEVLKKLQYTPEVLSPEIENLLLNQSERLFVVRQADIKIVSSAVTLTDEQFT